MSEISPLSWPDDRAPTAQADQSGHVDGSADASGSSHDAIAETGV